MFRKVLLFIFFMYILVGTHAQAPSKDLSLNSRSNLHSYNVTPIVYAAENGQHTTKSQNKTENSSWASFIVPGTVGIILIFGISSYWIVFRKKQLKKEA